MLWAPSASAQPSTAAAAEALFEQGRSLLQAGDYEHACPKFVESQHLDPASGTLLNIGVCYEKQGKTATAWAAFKEAESTALSKGRHDRAQFAEQHVHKLTPILSKLSVTVPRSTQVKGLKVVVDGIPMNRASWGVPIPMDPGPHMVEASAPKHVKWTKQIELGPKADRQQVSIPTLKKRITTSNDTSADKVKSETEGPSVSSSRATWGYVAGGVGLVALGVGGYFGMAALSKWDERNSNCEGHVCSDKGAQAGEDTDSYAYISDVGLGLGLVGVGLGAYLVLTSPSGSAERSDRSRVGAIRVVPKMGRDIAGLTVGGAW